jgi:hypothetical protein
MKPTRSFRIRMAIEFVVLIIFVALGASIVGDSDAWIVWRIVAVGGSIIMLNSALDRWGYFWDGPDE